MNIITNEYKIIDDLYNNNTYNIEEYKLIQILIKYLYLNGVTDKLQIREKIIETITKADESFMRSNWQDYIDKQLDRFLKNVRCLKNIPQMIDIKTIPVYEEELDIIKESKYKKFLFVLLIYSKVNNQLIKNKEWWTIQNVSGLLKESKTKVGNKKYRLDILKELKEQGFIEVYVKNAKVNIKVNFLKNDGSLAFEVTDFDNIIYSYLIYQGEKWKLCENCGKAYFKVSSNRSKYCNKCAKIIKNEQNKKYYKDLGK